MPLSLLCFGAGWHLVATSVAAYVTAMAGFSTMSGISWAHCSGGEGGCDEELGSGAVTTFRVISFMATAAVGRGARAPWVSVTWRGDVAIVALVTAVAADPGFQVPPPLFPRSCLLCVFQFIHSFFFFLAMLFVGS